MGGSGGGSSHTRPRSTSTRGVPATGGGAGQAPGGTNPCAQIDETVRLNSPQPAVLAQIKVTEVLKLRATNAKAPILAVTSTGQVAGSVIPSSLQRLLECMSAGYEYSATVESLKGGICVVSIRPA